MRRLISTNLRSLFLVWTIEATSDHLIRRGSYISSEQARRRAYLVPYRSIPLTSFSSSSGAQPPLTTSDAILANHRLRQSLFVLLGTCFAMACHLDGFGLSGSSVVSYGQLSVVVLSLPDTNRQTSLYSISKELVFLRSPRSTFSAKHCSNDERRAKRADSGRWSANTTSIQTSKMMRLLIGLATLFQIRRNHGNGW